VRVRCSTGRAAAAGQEHSTSRTPQRERKAARVKAGSGVVTVSPTVATRGPSGATRAASLAMRARTRQTIPATTVTRSVRSPWTRRQRDVHSAASVTTRSRSHKASAPGSGRHDRRSSARSTAAETGKAAPVTASQRDPNQSQTPTAKGQARNTWDRMSHWEAPQVVWVQKGHPGGRACQRTSGSSP